METEPNDIIETVEQAAAKLVETRELVEVLIEKVSGWFTGFVGMIPNLIVAVFVVVVAVLASRLLSRALRNATAKATQNQQIADLVGTSTRIGVVAGGLFVALGLLELDKTVASLLAGVGVVGLALGFAFQDIAANFMSGIILAIRKPFELGDLVQTHQTMGTVQRVSLRATVVRNFDGQLVIIPNREVLNNPIVNYTQSGERRIEIPVGVAYGTDLDEARGIALDAVDALEERSQERPVEAIFTGFGASSIDLSVRLWIDVESKHADYLSTRSKAVVAIKKAFDEADITIPFPIRTLDFGADGPEAWARAMSSESKEAA